MDRLCERDPWFDEMKRYKREEDMRTLIADGSYGLPLSCPCGGRMIKDTSTEEKYLICNVFKNDGLHIRKLWSLAIEEEVTKLRKEFDEKFKEDKSGLHEIRKEFVARIEKLFGCVI